VRSSIALVALLLALALGFLHGAASFKRERAAALAELFPPAPAGGAGTGAPNGGREGPSGAATAASASGAGTGLTEAGKGLPGASAGAGGATAGAGPGPGASTGTGGSVPHGSAADRDPTEAEIEAVKARLASGDEKRRAGDWKAARAAYEEAGRLLLGVRSVVALPLARLAQRGAAAAEVLHALAEAVPENEFAPGEGLRKVYLKSGREYVAKVLSMTGGQVSFRLANGIEIALPLTELVKPSEPCPKAEWRLRCRTGFQERLSKTDQESAFELYRLAAFALENGLREEAAPVLEQALAKDRPGLLPEYFCDAAKRPSRTTVQLARGGTEAEVLAAVGRTGAGGAAGGAGGSPSDAGTASGARPGGVPGEDAPREAGIEVVTHAVDPKLAQDPRWRRANERLATGIGHYRKSFRGSPDYEKELKSALAIFNEVATALDALRADFRESASLEDKLVEVNMARVDCRKRSGV